VRSPNNRSDVRVGTTKQTEANIIDVKRGDWDQFC